MRYAVAESAAYLAYVSIYAASKVQNLPARTIFLEIQKAILANSLLYFGRPEYIGARYYFIYSAT